MNSLLLHFAISRSRSPSKHQIIFPFLPPPPPFLNCTSRTLHAKDIFRHLLWLKRVLSFSLLLICLLLGNLVSFQASLLGPFINHGKYVFLFRFSFERLRPALPPLPLHGRRDLEPLRLLVPPKIPRLPPNPLWSTIPTFTPPPPPNLFGLVGRDGTRPIFDP